MSSGGKTGIPSAARTPSSKAGRGISTAHVARQHATTATARVGHRQGRSSREAKRLALNRRQRLLWVMAIAISVLGHVLLLNLIFSGQGLGMPGLGWPEPDRRARANDERIALLPPPRASATSLSVRQIRASVPSTAPRSVAQDRPLRREVKGAPSTASTTTTPKPVDTAQPALPPSGINPMVIDSAEPATADKPATLSVPGPGAAVLPAALAASAAVPLPASLPETVASSVSPPTSAVSSVPPTSGPEPVPNDRDEKIDSLAEQLHQAERARELELERQAFERQAREAQEQLAARQLAEQQEAAKQQEAERQRQAAERMEAARLEAERAQQLRVEAERLAALQAAALKEEAKRQEDARQAARQIEAAKQESERQESMRQAALRQEAAQDQERREAARRAMGRQLDEEAAQRAAASAAAKPSAIHAPSSSGQRRARLLGRIDANTELVSYAEAWARRIQLNTRPERVRAIARRPHTPPLVTVAIRSDGSVESITLVSSSGVADIDQAVRDIVQELLPYAPFPPALARDFDVIEIRRSWQFDTAVRLY